VPVPKKRKNIVHFKTFSAQLPMPVPKKRKKIVHFKMVQCTAVNANASAREKKENCSF
jgi:hypothetical protein